MVSANTTFVECVIDRGPLAGHEETFPGKQRRSDRRPIHRAADIKYIIALTLGTPFFPCGVHLPLLVFNLSIPRRSRRVKNLIPFGLPFLAVWQETRALSCEINATMHVLPLPVHLSGQSQSPNDHQLRLRCVLALLNTS